MIARGKDLARSTEDFDLFTVGGADDRFPREVWPWLRLAEHNLQAVLIRRPSDLLGLGLAWSAAELNASFNLRAGLTTLDRPQPLLSDPEVPQQLPSAKTEVDVIAALLDRPIFSHPLLAKKGLGAGLNEFG